MAHPMHHAESSAKKFGGKPEDYQAIHDWFDATKEVYADFRHRALRHHSQGIFECERVFGLYIVNSAGRKVPVRFIGEQHVKEDCGGRIPTVADWFRHIQREPWMSKGYSDDSPVDLSAVPGDLIDGTRPDAREACRCPGRPHHRPHRWRLPVDPEAGRMGLHDRLAGGGYAEAAVPRRT